MSYSVQGRIEEEERIWRNQIAEYVKEVAPDDVAERLKVEANLAAVHIRQKKYRDAVLLAKPASEEMARLRGEEDEATLAMRNILAVALDASGHHRRAAQIFERNRLTQTRRKSPNLIGTLQNLETTRQKLNHWAEAVELDEEVLALMRERHGDTWHVFAAMNNLAVALFIDGNVARARALNQEATENLTRLIGAENHLTRDVAQALKGPAIHEKRRRLMRRKLRTPALVVVVVALVLVVSAELNLFSSLQFGW